MEQLSDEYPHMELTKQVIGAAQLLTYLRLASKSVGLLINFNVPKLREGITRRVQTTHSPLLSSASSATPR